MKKLTALLLALLLCLSTVTALAQDSWTCPKCEAVNSSNFCGNCGTAKPAWTCASCAQQNKTNFCTNCGNPEPQYSASLMFFIYNGLVKDSLYRFPADNGAFFGDYTGNASISAGVEIVNITNQEQTIHLKIELTDAAGTLNTYSWNEQTLDAGENHFFYISSASLAAGTYQCTFYADDAIVGKGTYNVYPDNSDFYHTLNNHTAISSKVALLDLNTNESIKTITQEEYLANKEHLQFVPQLHIKNNTQEDLEVTVKAVLNGQKLVSWNAVTAEPDQNRILQYKNPAFQDGMNELVWYVNGIEVMVQTVEMDLDAEIPHALPTL